MFQIEPLEKEASEEMYIAEFYFQNNDFDKALNGDGQFSGFISVASDYTSTDAANLANYYDSFSFSICFFFHLIFFLFLAPS